MRTLLLTVNSFRSRIPRAARTALAIFLPGIIGLALGFGTETLLVSGGAVCVINGENLPYRLRWKSLLRYTAFFTAITVGFRSLGIWSHNHGAIDFKDGLPGVIAHPVGTLVAYGPLLIFLAVCVGCVFVHMSLRNAPPGPYLMLFVTGGLLVNKISISLWATLVWSLIGAAAAFIISMSGWFVDRRGPERAAVRGAGAAVDAYLSSFPDATRHTLQLAASTSIHRAWDMLASAGAVRGGRIPEDARGGRREALVHELLLIQQRWATANPNAHRLHAEPHRWDSIPLAKPNPWWLLRRQFHRYSHPAVTALRVAVAGAGVAVLSTVLGLGRPDWAITSVMLLLGQGPFRMAGTARSIHRVAGSAVGILLYLGFYQLHPGALMDLMGLSVAMFFTELLIAANYGLAMMFTAPLGLIMAGLGGGPVGQIALDRGLELLIASALSVLALWFVLPRGMQKTAGFNYVELVASLKELVNAYGRETLAQALEVRRRARFEWAEARATAMGCARKDWARYMTAQQLAGDALRAGAEAAHNGQATVPQETVRNLQRRVDALD